MDKVAQLLSPADLLRAFYLGASAFILVIQAVPALRTRFLAYGPRATAPSSELPSKKPSTSIDVLLDILASFKVPHNYFTHFYVLSVACSLFWGWQQRGQALFIVPIPLSWLLMFVQGARRLIESYLYSSKSSSNMWIGHYLLGLLFYLTINIAIWIEAPENNVSSSTKMLLTIIFTLHGLQHDYHAYLYRLRTENSTYQLPNDPLYLNLICPHYTIEVLIYLFMSFVLAPSGRLVNWTLASATIFVAVNLSVTAAGTWEWYVRQFGADKMHGRKRMVPWLW